MGLKKDPKKKKKKTTKKTSSNLIKAVAKRIKDKDNDEGSLQPIAASILMRILYAARMARFDLLRAVNGLACNIHYWTTVCDRQLHRLVSYINTTIDKKMVGYIGDNTVDVQPHQYCDASFAS